jgi:hypothetical protein
MQVLKVVKVRKNGNLESSNATGGLCVEYEPNMKITPPVGKLLAFDLAKLKWYHRLPLWFFVLGRQCWLAEAKNPVKTTVAFMPWSFNEHSARKFWGNGNRGLLAKFLDWYGTPDLTVGCDSITLLKRI